MERARSGIRLVVQNFALRFVSSLATGINPALLVILVVLAVFILTFIIVFTVGTGGTPLSGSPGSPTQPGSPGSPPGIPGSPPSAPGQPGIPGTPSPQPPPSGRRDAVSAAGLVNAIAASCSDAFVSQTTISCLKPLESTTPKAVLDRLKSSTFKWYYLQCVDFVQAVLILTNQPLLLKNGRSLPNALAHAGEDKVDGYKFIPRTNDAIIQIGDIPIWGGPSYLPYGHMAYVVDVTADNRAFMVVEANFGTRGKVQVMPKAKADPELSGWLRRI